MTADYAEQPKLRELSEYRDRSGYAGVSGEPYPVGQTDKSDEDDV